MRNRTYEQRKENIMKAVGRNNPEWVPVLVNAGNGTVAYAGERYIDAMESPERFATALSKIFDDMYADGYIDMSPMSSTRIAEAFRYTNQVVYGPDGTSLEHKARTVMEAEDYPALIENPEAFRKEIIIPRLYPFLFTDGIEQAKKTMQMYAEEMNRCAELGAALNERLKEKYQMVNVSGADGFGDIPLDNIFDYYRGFKNTMLDLRRRKSLVKAACDSLWETMDHMDHLSETDDGFVMYCPHIPTYLSTKDFEELYWPYLKIQLLNIAKASRKCLFACEGNWSRFYQYFREIPQNTCILMLDDDDPIATYDAIGDWHCIAAGAKLANLVLGDKQKCIDDAKRVIEHCAPGGSFIFTIDKPLGSPSDMKGCLVDVYNYVHEHY